MKNTLCIAGHGQMKFPNAGLLATSADRKWDGIVVERRQHQAGDIPPFVPTQTEVTMVLESSGGSRVQRRGDGRLQDRLAHPSSVWLCPAGVPEDSIRITGPLPSVLHVYLSDGVFRSLENDHCLPRSRPADIRYEAAFRDPLIEQLLLALCDELRRETAAGAMLAGSLACSLAARLVASYTTDAPKVGRESAALDSVRANRVIDYIEAHLEEELKLTDLAKVASLSQFHFIRAFKGAIGVAPHAYISQRRLARARAMLSEGKLSIAEIALASGFSSQSNFSRAFRAATGTTPGKYRTVMR